MTVSMTVEKARRIARIWRAIDERIAAKEATEAEYDTAPPPEGQRKPSGDGDG